MKTDLNAFEANSHWSLPSASQLNDARAFQGQNPATLRRLPGIGIVVVLLVGGIANSRLVPFDPSISSATH
jgi:hypothetical protein